MSPTTKAVKIYDHFYGYFISIILLLVEATFAKKHVIEMESENTILAAPNQTLIQRTGLDLFQAEAEARQRVTGSNDAIIEGQTVIGVTNPAYTVVGSTGTQLLVTDDYTIPTEHPDR